jgi:DNA-binding CsgD family transcriptional regulator
MTQSKGLRYRLPRAELEALWRRRKEGENLQDIAKALGTSLSSVYGVVARQGGIPPRPRRRSRRALSLAEREEISRQVALKMSAHAIARLLGVHHRRSVARFTAMEAGSSTERRAPMPRHGVGLGAPSAVASPNMQRSGAWSPRNSRRPGPRSRSPAGS